MLKIEPSGQSSRNRKCDVSVPFCGDFPAINELGGSGHGSEVSHPHPSSSSDPAAAERWGWERCDSSSHVWKWCETCKRATIRRKPTRLRLLCFIDESNSVPTLIERWEITESWNPPKSKRGTLHPVATPSPLTAAAAVEEIIGCEMKHSSG